MAGRTRREAMAMLAAGAAFARGCGALAQGPSACLTVSALDDVTAPILTLLPEAAVAAGLREASAGGPAAVRCDDWSPDGNATLRLAIAAARSALPPGPCDVAGTSVRALLDAASATADIPYGRNSPYAGLHRPYLVTAYAGPHIATPMAMRLTQDMASPQARDAWQAKLDFYTDALLGVAQSVRQDEAAGCIPPVTVSRAALPQMDALLAPPSDRHPLLVALRARLDAEGVPPAARDQQVARAAATLEKRVQPAMALLRDTVATVTRRGRPEIGVWAQKSGDVLHAANLARAGDTRMAPADIQALARAEAGRVAALLDKRLALRGLRKGSLGDRISAAFAAHPEFIQSDDEGGRAALLAQANDRVQAATALLPHWVSATALPPLSIRPVAGAGREMPAGSFYQPAAVDGDRAATLWLDTRSVLGLPVPGLPPLAYHLAVPGLHLQAALASVDRPLITRIAAWPAMTEGWAGYAEHLAAEQGLFAHDPWAEIASLSDELLRAARLVADIGIHAQRWTRATAEAEMTALTGSPQPGAIDRIMAMPGEAASGTLGLHRLLDLRGRAKASARHFDLLAFHAAVLTAGPRPFVDVEHSVLGI